MLSFFILIRIYNNRSRIILVCIQKMKKEVLVMESSNFKIHYLEQWFMISYNYAHRTIFSLSAKKLIKVLLIFYLKLLLIYKKE